jgi:hypothetical protein
VPVYLLLRFLERNATHTIITESGERLGILFPLLHGQNLRSPPHGRAAATLLSGVGAAKTFLSLFPSFVSHSPIDSCPLLSLLLLFSQIEREGRRSIEGEKGLSLFRNPLDNTENRRVCGFDAALLLL